MSAQWSFKHDTTYGNITTELMQYGDFQESVMEIIRVMYWHDYLGAGDMRTLDDLYEIYGGQEVM